MDIKNMLVDKPTSAEYRVLPVIVRARTEFDFYHEKSDDSGFNCADGKDHVRVQP